MHRIQPHRVTSGVRALFDPADPVSLRCVAVLDGLAAGTILVDDPARPAWGAVREACADGTTSLGGALTAGVVGRLVGPLARTATC